MRRLRVLFKTWLARRRAIIEFCHTCGREQPVIWHADDPLWIEVTGRTDGGGILCVECFDELAMSKGIVICWKPDFLLAHS